MDEILIDERKYVSSKQAAKVTGYAKDYIGQLCREGRVPARLVGRSWYVLETAIHDHRFGKQGIEEENKEQNKDSSSVLPPTWESPRYEASPTEILPPLGRPQDPESTTTANGERKKLLQDTQESWRAWFDRIAANNEKEEKNQTVKEQKEHIEDQEKMLEPEAEGKEEKIEEKKETNIPIRTLHNHFPEELLPQRHIDIKATAPLAAETKTGKEKHKITSSGSIKIFKVIGGLAALILFALAAINSGYFDKYHIISSRQASIITGSILYNK